jgi:hypothetical protein
VVAEEVVQLGARLHRRNGGFLRAVAAHGFVEIQRRLVHRAIGAAAVQHDVDAGRFQFIGREQRRLAKLGDVGEDRYPDRVLELPVLIERIDRLGEDHVGAGLDTGDRPFNRRLQAFDRDRVGACHDDEVAAARVDRGLDAVDHFFLRHDLFAGPVAATLGCDLIFDVHRRGAGLDQRAHGARDVERAAPTGIDVDQKRQIANVRDATDIGQHVFHRADAEVRHAERIRCDAAAG